jgi:hypothetical protein
MLYLYGETPLVNYGPRNILLHLYYNLLQSLFTFCKYYFISLQANISFHTIRLILCFQQTSEMDNLTASWGKVAWLCCVQVPHCCWRWHCTINCLLAPTSNNLQKWFLSPTGRLNFGFILRENFLLCSSYLPLGVSQWVLWDISSRWPGYARRSQVLATKVDATFDPLCMIQLIWRCVVHVNQDNMIWIKLK